MKVHQRRRFIEYSSTLDRKVVQEWEGMVKAWEHDFTKPDPFEEPHTCKCSVSWSTGVCYGYIEP